MQTEAARRNGMVHTAALPPAHHVRGLDTQVALRLALTKAASHGHQHYKGRLPHRNGVVTSPVVEVIAPRTEAAPSSSSGSSTRPGSLSELAPSPTDSRISTPVDHIHHHSVPFVSHHTRRLSQNQLDMEQRLAISLGRLRHRQLEITLTHSTSQLKHPALPSMSSSIERLSSSSLTSLPCSSPSSPGLLVDPLDSSGVSSLDTSCVSSEVVEAALNTASNVAGTLSQHLACLEQTVDEELTCSSSDEDVEEETRSFREPPSARKVSIKQRWERDRVKLGSQWAWLCHRVTSLNQQLRQIDAILHSLPPKEAVQFATPGSVGFPCICGLPNGQGQHDLIPKGNGSLLSSLHKAGTKPVGGNGSLSPCTCHLKKMLLANPSLVGQQLQVRDILGYSFPVLLMDESTQTCARTRMLRRAPRRRIMKKGKGSPSACMSGGGACLDPAHHPHLSLPTDYPSNLLLDSAINRVLQEHSYASMPLCKRRRAAVVLPPFESTPISLAPLLRLQRSRSFSPSPSPLDTPSDKINKGLGPRKRTSSHIPYLDDDYHLSTPTLPLSARKKKGVSTPSFDIDNIVIPYSMASSTRLEKLEYKEIITPKWREIEDTPLVRSKGVVVNGLDANSMDEEGKREPVAEPVQSSRPRASRKLDLGEEETAQKPSEEQVEQEDLSEAVYNCRHLKCEESERKRYLNFITGNTRKRNRLQASTPDSAHPHPIPPDGERMIVQVLPWPPRKFPLTGTDLDSLSIPPPPPKIIRYIQLADRSHSASPSPLSHPLTAPSHFASGAGTPPLHSASTAVTPVSSPAQTASPGSNSPDAESPLSQWTVTALKEKIIRQSNIILKLSRR